MSVINVKKINEVFLYVYSDDMGIEAELQEFFSYFVPGYRFMPKFKAKLWDGKIRMWDPIRKTIYTGLYRYIVKFAENNGYSINNINEIEPRKDDFCVNVDQYITQLNIHANGCNISARDYQIEAIYHALAYKRCILKSPTASGKSLIIYGISRYLLEQSKKVLVIVPSTSLCHQLKSDFEDYSSHNEWITEDNVDIIMSGFTKHPKKQKYKIMFEDGTYEIFTPNQKIITKYGEKLAKNLIVNDILI